VTAQYPAAGTRVAAGSMVKLTAPCIGS
jgi:hypothetical protein